MQAGGNFVNAYFSLSYLNTWRYGIRNTYRRFEERNQSGIPSHRVLCPILLICVAMIAIVGLITWWVGSTSAVPPVPEALVLSGLCQESRGQNVSPAKVVSLGHEKFALRFHRIVSRQESGNVIMSPYSVSSVMALVSLGARGNTSAQIVDGMSFPCDQTVLLEGYRQVTEQLQQDNGESELNNANRMYLDDKFSVNPEFAKQGLQYFKSAPTSVDFAKTEDARKEINNWVAAETRDKIKDLLASDSIDANTRMVLVNAIYFKGLWEIPFKKMDTRKMDFVGESSTMKVDMMHVEANFQLGDLKEKTGLNARMLKLPYQGERVAMYVVLPNENTTLAELEDNLMELDMSDPDQYLFPRKIKVEVKLPRFKLETTLDLLETAQNMGIADLFDPSSADLAGLTTSDSRGGSLYVSEVAQKAFVDVNEEGTEAAAATNVGVSFRTLAIAQEFVCDRPFIFGIRDARSGLTLFSGRYADPIVA